MPSFMLLLGLLFNGSLGYAATGWSEIAYEKKYDELSGEEWLKALAQDGRHGVLLKLIEERSTEFTEESKQFYGILSHLETKSPEKAVRVFQGLAHPSSRVLEVGLRAYIETKEVEKAFTVIRRQQINQCTPLAFYFLLDQQLYTEAEKCLTAILHQPAFETYQILEGLGKVKTQSRDTYSRWVRLIQLMRPADDLSRQLWVETSAQFGPLTSQEALRSLCRGNHAYCFNAAEFFRQNNQHGQAVYWAQFIIDPIERLRFDLNLFLDQKKYALVATQNSGVINSPLATENRYQYLMAYALVDAGKCIEAEQWVQALRKQDLEAQRAKLKKLSEQCMTSR